MKKIYIFSIIVVLILVVIGIDLFIPRGNKLSNIDYNDYDKLINTYSIIEKDNQIIITRYNTSPLKSKTIYEYEGESIKSIKYEREYLNKFESIWYYLQDNYSNKYNAKLKNNVISYYVDEQSIENITMIDIQELLNIIKGNEQNNIISE